jgi:FKBP-type peptidyl-prolyl cis-trans isomerase SlyD
MNIDTNKVVSFHYRLADETGQEIENSYEGEPMLFLHGHKSIVAGLEKAMEGKQAGDKFTATVPPAEGYGQRNEANLQRIPIKHLHGDKKSKARLRVGMVVSVETEQGPRQVTIVKAGKFNVDVDSNHPLAGRTLVFDVEVVDVREATADEISHGHAHGAGGHQH